MDDEKPPKVFLKVHRTQGEVLVAMCDCEALGRTFREGQFCMKVSERFYRGTLVDVDDCDPYLREATIGNFVGERSVSKAIKMGLVQGEHVIAIGGIPHAQMVRMFL